MRNWVIEDFAVKSTSKGGFKAFLPKQQVRRFIGLSAHAIFYSDVRIAAPCSGVKTIPIQSIRNMSISGSTLALTCADGCVRRLKFENSTPQEWQQSITNVMNSNPEQVNQFLEQNAYVPTPAQSRPAMVPTAKVDAVNYRPSALPTGMGGVNTMQQAQESQHMMIQMPSGVISTDGCAQANINQQVISYDQNGQQQQQQQMPPHMQQQMQQQPPMPNQMPGNPQMMQQMPPGAPMQVQQQQPMEGMNVQQQFQNQPPVAMPQQQQQQQQQQPPMGGPPQMQMMQMPPSAVPPVQQQQLSQNPNVPPQNHMMPTQQQPQPQGPPTSQGPPGCPPQMPPQPQSTPEPEQPQQAQEVQPQQQQQPTVMMNVSKNHGSQTLANEMVDAKEETIPMLQAPTEQQLFQMGFQKDQMGLYYDTYFPADQRCVIGNAPDAEQMEFFQNTVANFARPSQIHPAPQLIVNGVESSDVRQGALPDCWLLSALACVAEYPKLLEKVIAFADPADCYVFNLYDAGKWNQIIVDGFLPVDYNNQPVFAQAESGEFYVPLLEKAVAKLYSLGSSTGCYTSLNGGRIEHGLVMFTGGVPELVSWQNGHNYNNPDCQKRNQFNANEIWNNYISAMRPSSENQFPTHLLSASLGSSSGEETLECGIIAGHGYSIIGSITLPDGTRLVQLRNPWKGYEWNGAWCDNDPRWTPDLMRFANHSNQDDGVFFMSVEDFGSVFDEMSICHCPVPHVRSIKKTVSRWSRADGSAAGGASLDNPLFSISVPESACTNPDKTSTIILGMSQHNGGDIEPTYILSLVRSHTGDIVGPSENQRTFKNLEHLGYRLNLKSGNYFVVASTADPGEEHEFSLRMIALPDVRLARLSQEGACMSSCFASVWFKCVLRDPLPVGYGTGVPISVTVSSVGQTPCRSMTAVVVNLASGAIVGKRKVDIMPGQPGKVTIETENLMPGNYAITAFSEGPRGAPLALTATAVSRGTVEITSDIDSNEIGSIANKWF